MFTYIHTLIFNVESFCILHSILHYRAGTWGRAQQQKTACIYIYTCLLVSTRAFALNCCWLVPWPEKKSVGRISLPPWLKTWVNLCMHFCGFYGFFHIKKKAHANFWRRIGEAILGADKVHWCQGEGLMTLGTLKALLLLHLPGAFPHMWSRRTLLRI